MRDNDDDNMLITEQWEYEQWMRITVCFEFSDLLMQLYVVLGQFLQTMTYTCIFELVRRVKVQHELAFVICRSLISSLKLQHQMIWVRIGIF